MIFSKKTLHIKDSISGPDWRGHNKRKYALNIGSLNHDYNQRDKIFKIVDFCCKLKIDLGVKDQYFLISKVTFRISGQDGWVGKCCTCLLPWPHQNYN